MRSAFGDSCSEPDSLLLSNPESRNAFSKSRRCLALVAVSAPKRSATSSKSMSPGRSPPRVAASSSRPPRSRIARVASPRPMPPDAPSPSNDSDPVQSRSGRMPRRFASSSPTRFISSSEPKASAASCMSSARCSGVMDLSKRRAAADRCASSSTNSSMLRGFSGN